MRHSVFYLITPKPELLTLVSSFDEGTRSLFADEQLWENNEGGKSSWTIEGHEAKSKFAFLVNMCREYEGLAELERVIPKSKISIELFDKYWSIKRYEAQGNTEEAEVKAIPKENVQLTGMPDVDNWLIEYVIR